MSIKDSLGDRMKENYENRYRIGLPRRTYVIIRLDGKSFHSYTRSFDKPYDTDLMDAFDFAATRMFHDLQGTTIAYQQSDELSLLLTDFTYIDTEAAFDNSLQKLCSVSASMLTAYFNDYADNYIDPIKTKSARAFFDSRVFVIPDPIEVYNYFVWRQKDCIRNSINLLGQAHFSHAELHGKNTDQVQEMLFTQKSINWADQFSAFKNGNMWYRDPQEGVTGKSLQWAITTQKDWFMGLIPTYNYEFKAESS